MDGSAFLLCCLTLAGVLHSYKAAVYEDAGNVYCVLGREFTRSGLIRDLPERYIYTLTGADECKALCTDMTVCYGVTVAYLLESGDYDRCVLLYEPCYPSIQQTVNSTFRRHEVFLKKGMNDQTEEEYRAQQDAKKECLKENSLLMKVFKFVDTNNDDHICDDEVAELLKMGALLYFGDMSLVDDVAWNRDYYGFRRMLQYLPQPCSTFELLVDTFVDRTYLLPNPYLGIDLNENLCK